VGAVRAAWDLVDAAAAHAGVEIRPLTDLEDADRIRRVVELVWEEQVPPREIIRAMQHAGGVLFGADHKGELVGFVWGFVGLSEGLHLHSHMLGVLPEWQVRGVGYALKLAQRADCLDQGIEEVRWTYDPLVARNARFNLVKLGAEAFRFLPQFYGDMTDRLNRKDRSDRFEVRWRLRSDRALAALEGRAVEPAAGAALLGAMDDGAPSPRRTGSVPAAGSTVAIPPNYYDLKSSRPELAARWRTETVDVFQSCFDRGLIATWLTRDAEYVFDVMGDG
jgi:predicted GNAT superfamily acetyltransferase